MSASTAPAEEWDVDGVAVRVTNPDKIYYPALGGSGGRKRDLVEYYRSMAVARPDGSPGPLLRAFADRPTHLQRFPEGVDGEEVYQKRIPKFAPDFVHTCRVTFPSGRTAEVLRVDAAAPVVWAAQQAAVTLHPWPVRCADTEHPDELRIDLDPQPGTSFPQAREVAIELVRPLFDELGMASHAKTSGGRGIHVSVRIEPVWSFVQVRHAAIAFAREVERRSGGRVTTSWWKEERGERIFLDYNQTARDRTMAGAYSARRTPRATVSTPLTWDELGDADPDDCTIATVPALVERRGNPWAELDAATFSLEPLLEMAVRDEADGLPDLPYPPNYPKMPGEPKRVQPSKSRPDTVGNAPPVGMGLPDLD